MISKQPNERDLWSKGHSSARLIYLHVTVFAQFTDNLLAVLNRKSPKQIILCISRYSQRCQHPTPLLSFLKIITVYIEIITPVMSHQIRREWIVRLEQSTVPTKGFGRGEVGLMEEQLWRHREGKVRGRREGGKSVGR